MASAVTVRRPILIQPGATFSLTAKVEAEGVPLNTLGYSATLVVKRTWRPFLPAVLELSNDDGSEVVFQGDGLITFTATAEQTLLIPSVPGRRYYYIADLISPEGHVYRLAEGRAVVSPLVP